MSVLENWQKTEKKGEGRGNEAAYFPCRKIQLALLRHFPKRIWKDKKWNTCTDKVGGGSEFIFTRTQRKRERESERKRKNTAVCTNVTIYQWKPGKDSFQKNLVSWVLKNSLLFSLYNVCRQTIRYDMLGAQKFKFHEIWHKKKFLC